MGNRITIHQEIKDLCKKLKDTNKVLSESNDLSMLDIDLLRKTTIEIYDRINQLRLVMSDKVEVSTQATQPAEKTPEVKEESREKPKQPEAEVETGSSVPETGNSSPETETVNREQETESVKEIEATEEEVKEEPKAKPQLVAEEEEDDEEEEPQDLASMFGSSPIKDLKREISIAKKFEFINSLFAGNMERYAHSIHRMNGAESGDEAFSLLNELREEYKWEEEDKNYMELANLIRRRYLS